MFPPSNSQAASSVPMVSPDPNTDNLFSQKKEDLQKRMGFKVSQIARVLGTKTSSTVEAPIEAGLKNTADTIVEKARQSGIPLVQIGGAAIGSIVHLFAGPAAKLTSATAKRVVVDPETALLKATDRLDRILSRTSPQELGETLHLLTDFLTSYRTAFTLLEGVEFASREEEDQAWMGAMGPSWHPLIDPANLTPEQKQASFAALIQDTVGRLETVLFSKNRLLSPALPGIQELALKLLNYFIGTRVDTYKAHSQEILMELSSRQNLYQKIYTFVAGLTVNLNTRGFQLPTEQAPIPDHHILVENVTSTRQVVFYCSARAHGYGVRVGMDPDEALRAWNEGVAETLAVPETPAAPGIPEAVIVDVSRTNMEGPWLEGQEPLSFGGRLPLRAALKSIIFALLSQTPGVIYDKACDATSRIPYLGRPLTAILKAIFWMVRKGAERANRSIQFPSAEVLAEEISTNLVRHLYSPVFISAPLLVFSRILDILEGKQVEGHTTSNPVPREAFFGELLLALPRVFQTICPSLFNHAYPNWVHGCVAAAMWMVRKTISLGTKVLSWRLTQAIAFRALHRFSSPNARHRNRIVAEHAFRWIGECSTLLAQPLTHLEMAHSLLSSGYRTLGDLGVVSSEQTHFERGRESSAQLLHQTIVAAARIFIAVKSKPLSVKITPLLERQRADLRFLENVNRNLDKKISMVEAILNTPPTGLIGLTEVYSFLGNVTTVFKGKAKAVWGPFILRLEQELEQQRKIESDCPELRALYHKILQTVTDFDDFVASDRYQPDIPTPEFEALSVRHLELLAEVHALLTHQKTLVAEKRAALPAENAALLTAYRFMRSPHQWLKKRNALTARLRELTLESPESTAEKILLRQELKQLPKCPVDQEATRSYKNFFDEQMAYRILLSKARAGETLSDAELKPLQEHLRNKRALITLDRESISLRYGMIRSIRTLIRGKNRIPESIAVWRQLGADIAREIEEQKEKFGVAHEELESLLQKITAMMEALSDSQEYNYNESESNRLAADHIQLIRELRSLFFYQRDAMNSHITALTTQIEEIRTLGTLQTVIDTRLNESRLEHFAHARQEKEQTLLRSVKREEATVDNYEASVIAEVTGNIPPENKKGYYKFACPDVVDEVRRHRAKLLARKLAMRDELAKLPHPSLLDPAWLLEKSGAEIIAIAKKNIPLEKTLHRIGKF